MIAHPPLEETGLAAFVLALLSSFALGISKSGLKGIGVLIVTLMALAYGARTSTGLLVPLLICGDIFAVVHYHRHTRWEYVWRLLPWILAGLLFGAWIGKDLPEATFKWAMGGIILASVGVMAWWDLRKSKHIPKHWGFAGVMGILAGITSMVGNLAGAFSNLYFLAMRLPKNEFIGTVAWLFLLINLVKLPLHIFAWGTITPAVLQANLRLFPALLLGLLLGIRLVRSIREPLFRKLILVLTALGAALLLLRPAG
jgi:uncharacterized membrane protein YfcA